MDKFKGIIDDKYEAVIKEFQGVISFGYVILIILGMIFESIYYSQFGINIFKYSGILDFLLVPFRRPVVLIILLGIFLFSYLYFIALYDFLKKKYPGIHKSVFRGVNAGAGNFKLRIKWLIIFFIVTTTEWAYVTSKKEKEVLFKKDVDISIEYDISGQNSVKGKLIDKNDLNIFILDKDNLVQIIPANSNIIRIRSVD